MSGLVDTVDRGSYHQQDLTSPEDEEVDAILQVLTFPDKQFIFNRHLKLFLEV